MAHERPEYLPLGRLVVEQRHHLSLSQTDVVRRIHSTARADGRQSGATKQWISEIERTGRIPHPDALRWLAASIEVPVERVVVAADEQRRLRRRDMPGGQPPRERALESAARLLRASVDGRAPPGLPAGLFVPVRNGMSVDAEAMNAFRAADRQVGGGHLYGTVARREVREELGLDLAVGRLLCVDWVSPHGPWDDTLMFLFDGGTLTAAESASVRLLDKELVAFQFCTEDQAARLLRRYVWRRVRAALQALQTGQVRYLQDGQPVGARAEQSSP
jgi:8-oxo-dGTP pyrophosphatase MutT (NUDIX family)